MINWILNLYYRRKYKIEKVIKNEWFAYAYHNNLKYPPTFDQNGKFIEYTKGMIVSMREIPNGKVVYYSITNVKYRSGDWLYDSDGYKYDLKFSHVK